MPLSKWFPLAAGRWFIVFSVQYNILYTVQYPYRKSYFCATDYSKGTGIKAMLSYETATISLNAALALSVCCCLQKSGDNRSVLHRTVTVQQHPPVLYSAASYSNLLGGGR